MKAQCVYVKWLKPHFCSYDEWKQRILAWAGAKTEDAAALEYKDRYAALLYGSEQGWFYFNNMTTLWRLLEIVSCGLTYLAAHLLNFMVDWVSRTPMQFIQPCQVYVAGCLLAERIFAATVSHPSTCWIFRERTHRHPIDTHLHAPA